MWSILLSICSRFSKTGVGPVTASVMKVINFSTGQDIMRNLLGFFQFCTKLVPRSAVLNCANKRFKCNRVTGFHTSNAFRTSVNHVIMPPEVYRRRTAYWNVLDSSCNAASFYLIVAALINLNNERIWLRWALDSDLKICIHRLYVPTHTLIMKIWHTVI